jgi:membrane-associated protease RseP (regulator of RpoE activity)
MVARWSDIAIGTLLLTQLAGIGLVAYAATDALAQEQATALNDPVNTIAIPGVNSFMPLASAPYVVFALLLATLVHEGGHALACRAADITIDEWGLALLAGIVPLAGYVLPTEELDSAVIRTQLRVFAIGVFHNLLVTAGALGILLTPLTASPRAAFVEYFGWAVLGTAPPTAGSVAALGVLTNLCFWLAFLNANFAILNAMPVAVLDGGRVLSLSLERLNDLSRLTVSATARTVVVNGASVFMLALLAMALFAPHV